jgi:DNA-binding XRE family transcriptional regulator
VASELSKFLIEEIRRHDLSFRQVADKAGCSHTTIANIINDSVVPSVTVCQGLARAFEVPAERIYQMAGILPESGDMEPEIKDWNRRLTGLRADDRRRVIQAMDAVLFLAEELAEYNVRQPPEPDQ